jgi:hypothetical protein
VSAAIPVAQVAQAPGQRSAAQKPQPRSAGAPTRQPSVKAGEGTRAPETPSKSKAPLLIGLGVAAAIGIGAFVMFGGKKPERQATTTAPDSTTQTSINIAPASLNNDGGRRPEFFPLPLPKRPSEAGKVIVWRLDGKPVDPTDPEAKIPEGLDDVVMLAAGQDGANPPAAHHLLALHSDGHISAWGGNAKGQAKPPANLTNIISVAATTAMSIALDATGHVIPWGESSKVNSMPHITEKVVSIGGSKGLGGILMTSGKVLAFGDPGIAKRVADSSSPLADRAISIASAGDFIAVLRDDGALFAMGNAVGVVDGREGNHPITEPRLTLPGFPEVNRFPLVAGTLPKLWVNNSTTDIWVSGFEKSPIRIRSELPGYVKNSSKFLLMRTLDLAGLEYIAQGEAAAALKFGSSWRFERASGASNIPYCESQAEGCLQLAFTKNHAFGIKPLSVIAAQKLAATPAAPVPAPAVMVPAAVPQRRQQRIAQRNGRVQGSRARPLFSQPPRLPVF